MTNQDHQGIYMYHKGARESVDCLDDIVLIQGNNVENNNAIQHLKVRGIFMRNIRTIMNGFRQHVSSNILLNINTMKKEINSLM